MEKYKKVMWEQEIHIIVYVRYLRLFWTFCQKTWKKDCNSLIQIYINKIENKITFKIKTGYYPEILTPETMKLLGSTTDKITKDKDGENVPHLEITEVALINCDIVKNKYQRNSRVLTTFVPNEPSGQLLDISPKKIYIFKNFSLRIFIYWSLVCRSKF